MWKKAAVSHGQCGVKSHKDILERTSLWASGRQEREDKVRGTLILSLLLSFLISFRSNFSACQNTPYFWSSILGASTTSDLILFYDGIFFSFFDDYK